jgi:hypothetical protein
MMQVSGGSPASEEEERKRETMLQFPIATT